MRWRWHGAIAFIGAALLAVTLVEAQKSQASNHALTMEPPVNVRKIAEPAADALQPEWEMERFEVALPAVKSVSRDRAEVAPVDNDWQTFIVKPGYNLAIICSRAGVMPGELHAIMQLGEPVSVLSTLRPNDSVRMKITPDGKLLALEYDIHESKRLLISRVGDTASTEPNSFEAQIINRPLEVREAYASGVIESSLIMAARKVQLDMDITYELMRIFGWDIDFSLEVRRGDRFTVVYEEYYQDGEKIATSSKNRQALGLDKPIIAAEFINNGRVVRAIRYTDPDGNTDYYTPDGSTIRKAFMRNPVDARISSYFNPNRRHPILNKIRAHKGVDYAAPTGTPIKVVGDGKVVFHGQKGGYGNTLIIQHGERYSTLYAHMSRFAADTAKGRKVKQGQVIGYIGHSGLATGPHLHFEFRIDGVHRNPLTVQLPSVAPIPQRLRADFQSKTSEQLAQLDTLSRLQLALDQQPHQPHS